MSVKGKTERKRSLTHGSLTPREAEIYSHLVGGLDPQAIAIKLRLNKSTVYTLCGRIKTKLDAKTLHDLEILAVRRGGRPPH
jgi:DNA-binding CsgD family transcriptional regulator